MCAKRRIIRRRAIDYQSLYEHQDTMMWSRLQHLTAVQVASLGGAFATKEIGDGLLAIVILFFGVVLGFIAFFLSLRDNELRQIFKKKIGLINKCEASPYEGHKLNWTIAHFLLISNFGMLFFVMRHNNYYDEWYYYLLLFIPYILLMIALKIKNKRYVEKLPD